MERVLHAAKSWADARTELCKLTTKDPDYREKLNQLSEAEDTLNKCVNASWYKLPK